MNKIELKEMDREILWRWEQKVLLEKIELQYPKARSRIQAYKNRGVVGEGRAVDWAKFEAADPPQMRTSGGEETLQRTTDDATGDATTPLQRTTETTGETLRRTTEDATKAELETLQRRYAVLQDRLAKVEAGLEGAAVRDQVEALQARLGTLEEKVALDSRPSTYQDGGVRSGERSSRPRSYRFDTGLLKALQDRAGAEGISETEALHRAIEAYLAGAGGQ